VDTPTGFTFCASVKGRTRERAAAIPNRSNVMRLRLVKIILLQRIANWIIGWSTAGATEINRIWGKLWNYTR